ncbi:MAG TPA: DUF4350 domain-containing protein [Accumulibacter sp.]|uniref:DUF4350 domain-containing protein n=1 Tax=Accumulibacter sp. TaxID=2053492 RepID=UPI002CA14586|nr:DUF4350 domain-containing protein [Accumulibacter sp.]HNJ51596.1 DUF4350 domain-containing protein [Accumulibacter sp.]
MKQRALYAGLLLCAALGLAGFWLLSHLERVPVVQREPAQDEARRNPYLALERFTERQGGRLARSSDARVLARLPPAGTLFLDRQRPQFLSTARLQELLDWVANGGYLIAVAELPGVADPLLDSLGISRTARPPRSRKPAGVLEVALPGADRTLRVDLAETMLRPGVRQPDWAAGRRASAAQILHFSVGRGHLTVAVDLDQQLSNARIGDNDHAELYWSLLERYDRSPQPQVLLLSRLRMPTLFAWLWEIAWAACLSAGALLGLWVWRVVPRFGNIGPDAPPGRRELREHLAAIGRYLWRSGGLSALLAPARERFQRRLQVRQPAIAALPPEARAVALGALSHRPAAAIAAALAGQADNPRTFTAALRLLRNLERDL